MSVPEAMDFALTHDKCPFKTGDMERCALRCEKGHFREDAVSCVAADYEKCLIFLAGFLARTKSASRSGPFPLSEK